MRYLEIIFSFIILIAISSQLIPLIHDVFHLSIVEMNISDFTTFLANAALFAIRKYLLLKTPDQEHDKL